MDSYSPFGPFESTVREALAEGWRVARRRLLTLNAPSPETLLYPVDGPSHVGDAQHMIDAVVLDAVEDVLRRDWPDIRVIGEECIRSVLPRQYPIAILDPIDGTKPFTHLAEAWAIVLIILTAQGSRTLPLIPAAGIVTSSGVLVGMWNEQSTTVALIEDPESTVLVSDCSLNAGSGVQSLACVGAKPRDREYFRRLTEAFPEATHFNVGGNPVVLGILTGDLDAIISFNCQTTWDAAYALAVALGGGTVGDINKRRVFAREEIVTWFRTVRQGDAKEAKHVPAIIVAKNEATYDEIVAVLNE